MNRSTTTALMLWLLAASSTSAGLLEDSGQPGKTTSAIVDVSVIPMNREVVLHNQTVLIRDERIVAVGPNDSVVVPEGAARIEGKGRFLLPGLSDMHAHLRRRKGHRPQDYLEAGVTVIRNMAGDEAHLKIRQSLMSGELPGPLFHTTGQPLTSSEMFPSHRLVATAAEGRQAVREQFEAGYDYVKVYSLLSREAFDGIAAEAKAVGMPVIGHVSDQVGLRHAIERGQTSVEHLYGYFWELESDSSSLKGKWDPRRLFHAVEIDPEKLVEVATMTAEAGIWNCPTMWRKNNYLTAPVAKRAWGDPELRTLGEANRLALVGSLHKAGALLLTGTDDRAEIIHEELQLFVEAGLTPYEALRTSTVNAAQYFDAADEFGTVEVGRLANLLLIDGDPLADIRNTRRIVGVMMKGTWIPAR